MTMAAQRSSIAAIIALTFSACGGTTSREQPDAATDGGPLSNPWPMLAHDVAHTGHSSGPGLPHAVIRWTFATSAGIYGGPAIAGDGTVYVGSMDGSLYAVTAAGTMKWVQPLGSPIDPSSPAIGTDGVVYVASTDSKLHAVGPDGTEQWALATGGPSDESPVIADDGTIFVSTNMIYAVHPDGTVGQMIPLQAGPSFLAIAPDGTLLDAAGDNRLHAVARDGTEKWSFAPKGIIGSAPTIDSSGNVILGTTGGADSNFIESVAADGHVRWAFSLGVGEISSETSVAIGSDGTVLFGASDGHLYSVDENGGQRWVASIAMGPSSAPAVASDGTIYVATFDHVFRAFAPTGAPLWTVPLGGGATSSPAIGADGTVYVGCDDGKLYAIGM